MLPLVAVRFSRLPTKPWAPLALVVVALVACGEDEPLPVDRRPLAVCKPPARGGAGFALVPALGGAKFESPVELTLGPGNRFYVVEQAGRLAVVPPEGAPTVALDIHERLVAGGEAGLLGVAFDPDFAQTGYAYFYFTRKVDQVPDRAFQDVVARFESRDGGLTFDPNSEKELLALDDPYPNNNGGHLAFGPDRMLYVSIGDGGNVSDPKRYGQNKDVLFGKILRIDPRAADPYGVPPDNPFAGGGGRGEIWAYGLRNPWKFSFDRKTGDLWSADVGQSTYEEINLITRGGNYGWSVREGRQCFGAGTCAEEGFVDPIVEYGRAEGTAVVAGYVYRGTKIPALSGHFLYGDFGSGNIWATTKFGQSSVQLLLASGMNISTFGQDERGEVLVADYASGAIWELAPAPEGQRATGEGSSLAQTGCYAIGEGAPRGAIPYSVNSPLWSDGAEKERWVFVPENAKINVGEGGDFDLPVGSTAVKTFAVSGKPVETRLFTRFPDGWAGFSYEWNDAGTDAVLLETGKTKDVPGGTWTYPSRSECFSCHTPAAGFTLGLEVRQLDRSSGGKNVLDGFARVLAAPVVKGVLPPLAALEDTSRSAEDRARSYLHSNCSMCHREGGGAGSARMDLRVDRVLAEMGVCNAEPSAGALGIVGAKLVAPGSPSTSLLPLRMRALDEARMPPLTSKRVDEAGVSTVEAWIGGLSCP